MKKLLRVLILFLAVAQLPHRLSAQNTVFDCGFDGYVGTAVSVPCNLFISWNSAGTNNSFYTSAGNFGVSPPSYKFGVDSATIVTPVMALVDSITFWAKGNSISPLSELQVSHSMDSVTWITDTVIANLPTSAKTIRIPFQQASGYFRFVYRKDVGNLGMDDLKVYSSSVGLSQAASKEDITVYPSPSTGIINFRLTGNRFVSDPFVEVYDMLGNKVFSAQAENKGRGIYSIDLSDKNKGFYFLKVRTGTQIITRRITITN